MNSTCLCIFNIDDIMILPKLKCVKLYQNPFKHVEDIAWKCQKGLRMFEHDTSSCYGKQMCEVISKLIQACRRYSPDTQID